MFYIYRIIISLAHIATKPLKWRGFGHIVRKGSQLLGLAREVRVVPIHNESKFRVMLNDPYWVTLLVPWYKYEPEVANVLEQLLDDKAYFFDCGANQGYWSLFASEQIDQARIFSVEASKNTAALFQANKELNGRSFTVLNNALGGKDGEEVLLRTEASNHAGASVTDSGSHDDDNSEAVIMRTLDSLIDEFDIPIKTAPIVIKLDVEGCEIPSLEGAAKLLSEGDVAIIYEEFTTRSKHPVTDFIVDTLKLSIYFVSRAGKYHLVDDLAAFLSGQDTSHGNVNLVAVTEGGTLEKRVSDLAALR